MTVYTSAGTALGLIKASPDTYDVAGYGALVNGVTKVGEISDLGDIPARLYEIVTWRNVTARGEAKLKGGFTLGSQTITVGIDPQDAGQQLIDEAILDDDMYSVIIAHPRLGTICARALVTGGAKNYGDVNTIATRQITLEYSIVSDEIDGLVFIPAPGTMPAGAFDNELGMYITVSPEDGTFVLIGE